MLPLAPSLDHVGVMANCVRDLAILFQADRRDRTRDDGADGIGRSRTVAAVDRRPPDSTAHPAARPARADCSPSCADPDMRAAFDGASPRRDHCDDSGLRTRVPLPPAFADVLDGHRTIMAVEAAAVPRATGSAGTRTTTRRGSAN